MKRILFLDEDRELVNALRKKFSPEYKVSGTTHPGVALGLIRRGEKDPKQKVDALVLDTFFPDTHFMGKEEHEPKYRGLVAASKARAISGELGIVFFTLVSDSDINAMCNMGGIVVKPASVEELKSVIETEIQTGKGLTPRTDDDYLQLWLNRHNSPLARRYKTNPHLSHS